MNKPVKPKPAKAAVRKPNAPAKPLPKPSAKPLPKPAAAKRPGASRKPAVVPAPSAPPLPPVPPVVAPDIAVLSLREQRFVDEYLIDLNGSQAFRRANPRTAETTARNEASKLARRPAVAAAIAAGMKRLAARADVDAAAVVRRLGLMATADERELMEVRVGCCRFCWGEGFRYQYTVGEMELARADHAAAVERDEASGAFDEKGGTGFNANDPTNPECIECFGDGKVRPVFKDTRYLSEGAAMLFAGLKETRDGIEVKMHSRADALVQLGRHYGIFNDKLKVDAKVDATEELKQFLRERGASRLPLGAGSE